MSSIRSRAILLLAALAVVGCKDKPTTGSLVVTVNGLPSAAPAAVRVTGPSAFSQQVSATTTLDGLPPGEYTVRVETVHFTDALYTSQTTSEKHTVTAGHTESSTVAYELASGMVDIHVSGLPSGTAPSLVILGPGFNRTVLTDGIVGELPPGTYELRADTLANADGDRFGAEQLSQPFTVSASLTPVVMSVVYALSSGSLTINVAGLPAGLSATPVTVTGPGSFSRNLSVTTTYRGLAAGTYTVSAVKATGLCPNYYLPDVASQAASVSIGTTAGASVTFAENQIVAANLNLKVDQVHLVQVVQDYNGGTPLVAGKPALLRVFGLANQCNFATPKVRITISGGSPIDRMVAEGSVREAPDQGTLQSSWNAIVPGEIVQPGMTVTAVIDPDNAIAEANEADNSLGPKTIDVRTVPTVGLRFVPVTVAGATGNVSADRVDDLLALSRKIHPVLAYDADIAAPFTATGAALTANDGDGWGRVLGDLETKRVADQGSNPTARYYVGIVKVSYNSGIAGIGFVGGKSTLNWDYIPSASEVIAHELGHNYGRNHTPCGNPSGIDTQYPNSGAYANGFIGQFGYDLASELLKPPTQFSDIMGYCSTKWISDYTYFFMMQWITTHAASLPDVASAAQSAKVGGEVPSLLVWGRIVNGQPVLEPAFELNARPQLPQPGANRLVGTDDSGAEILSLSFAANRIADLPGDHQSFAFVIPVSLLRGRSLAELALTSGSRTVRSRASGEIGADAQTVVTQVGPRLARVQWDAAKFPVVMVRDVVSGQVIAFARGGDASIVTSDTGRDLELVYSNRVQSARVVRRWR
ncbi:MAG TPA: hypothetical protein VFT29_12355 [Gemmatimonadaceae bacterium]|nr:hypothetical protein [Gemmatimonadaceae bacterium]